MDTLTVALVITTQVFVLIAMCYIIRIFRIFIVDYRQELRRITAELELLEQWINRKNETFKSPDSSS